MGSSLSGSKGPPAWITSQWNKRPADEGHFLEFESFGCHLPLTSQRVESDLLTWGLDSLLSNGAVTDSALNGFYPYFAIDNKEVSNFGLERA